MGTRSEPLRVAIAGCHRMVTTTPAGHNWAAGFAGAPDTRVVAVMDRGDETRAQFQASWRDTYGDIAGYDDYDTMLREVSPDIVCITTRQTYHADQVEAAVNAGVKGILCEKPLATTLEEADRIFAAVEQAKIPLAYGLELRWSPRYQRLFSLIKDGAVGEVTAVQAFGITELINHGCHWYDLALGLVGDSDPTWVSGFVNPATPDPADWVTGDPHGRGWVGLDNGVHMSFVPEGAPRSFVVLGTAGRLTILNEAGEAYLWEANRESGRLASSPRDVDLPTPSEPWPTGPACARDLARAVRTGGKTLCDVPGARRATEIGFGIHASSAAEGARVTVPVADRKLRIDSRPWGNE